MISEETKAYRKQWHQANPDYWKRSYLKHREERIAKACEYARAHRAEISKRYRLHKAQQKEATK